jgi:hypothetical protein
MKYVRPQSLTWWSGVAAATTGVAVMAMPGSVAITETGKFIALLAGGADASPAALLFLGTGLIGIRERMERGFREPK